MSGHRIPIEFEGVRYPSRKALAQHFAATRGGTASTWAMRLSRLDGDMAKVLAVGPPLVTTQLSLTYEGRTYTRKGLARHLAATLGGTIASWNARLSRHGDDVAAVLAGAANVGPRAQPPRTALVAGGDAGPKSGVR
jgi:hypothetical protein